MIFSELLETEFAQRRERNPRYSVRAFARDLALDHSALSKVLRHRRPLSARMIARLGHKLRLSSNAIIAACIHEHAQAIVSLARTPEFRPHSRWIATRTGIPLDAVNIALHHLLSHGIIEMHSAARWRITQSSHA